AVKLIDFGVARAFGRVAHTSPSGLKGKIEYMSPEQASAEEVDHRADVLALRKRRDARFASAHEMAQALERFAFSNEGFSPLQVASYMKGLFAAEFLQWRKTATAALDMEVDRGDRQARLEAPGAEPPTQGPTMALRPGLLTGSGVRAPSEVKS